MLAQIKKYKQLISNMGWRYISFRSFYELKRKAGLLKKDFPTNPPVKQFLTLEEWKKNSRPFFFQSREELIFPKDRNEKLREEFRDILDGKISFFSYQVFDLGLDYDWLTNPDSGFKYDNKKHWTEVNDYSQEAGDIKYVWEKSRFSYLFTVIRYDYHFEEDHSKFVFQEIESWINANPINKGPNYKCSQEISLRILNWIFALYFYKHSSYLSENLFQKIIHNIYWQLHHIYHNINFSRIAVRNNHAITETLTLYIISTLFPQFPNSSKWKTKGKKWFEEEIQYQVYDDGTFLQFSMNYHRVVIQLLTWAIQIAGLNQDKFDSKVYDKAYKSVNFLYQCQEDSNGYLPNYGSNDGALFFNLSNNNYRDYRPQLDTLHFLLTGKQLYISKFEDIEWFGKMNHLDYPAIKKEFGTVEFSVGGYYLIREKDTLTFLRCGKHKDRPGHADNLHIDIWYKGENILLDGGTYKYNTDNDTLKYFMGTESHNTVMLDNYDQMKKGSRFIWYNWTQAINAELKDFPDYYEFKGQVSCFTYLSENIVHERSIRKFKNKPEWEIEDIMHNKPLNLEMRQLWHIPLSKEILFNSNFEKIETRTYYSSCYGQKEMIKQIVFQTKDNELKATISV